MSHKSSVPLYWRLRKSKYNLVGSKCTSCGTVFFPPRKVCPKCRSKGKLEDFEFSGNGKIVTWTAIHAAPEGFEYQVPYPVAIVQLDEGVNIAGQIVGDIKNVRSGKRVKPVFRRMFSDDPDGLIHYGIKFELVEDTPKKDSS